MNVTDYIFVDVCREREALSAENIARYQALKAKWKELMRTYQPPLEPDVPETVPLYLRECQNFHINNDPTADVENRLSGAAVRVEEMDASSHVGDEQLVFLNLTAKVCFHKRPGWNAQMFNCSETCISRHPLLGTHQLESLNFLPNLL